MNVQQVVDVHCHSTKMKMNLAAVNHVRQRCSAEIHPHLATFLSLLVFERSRAFSYLYA